MNPEREIPRTRVNFSAGFTLDQETCSVVSVGSCFSEKLIALLAAGGMDCAQNPSGIIYNPVSMLETLEHVIDDVPYTEDDFFFFNGLWHGYGHHGAFSRPELSAAVENAEKARLDFRMRLADAGLVILTPATCVVFTHLKTGRTVANCHKVPGTEFSRTLLTQKRCSELTDAIVGKVLDFNKNAKVVLSLSPVRHHPGDPALNARSKAQLLSALRETEEKYERTVYFPEFEIMNDELRDYRFYRDDTVHPSDAAADMILSTFVCEVFGAKGRTLMERAERNLRAAAHVQMNRQEM